MKIEIKYNNVDIDVYLKQHKGYTEIIIFGFINYIPQGDSFNLKMNPRQVKKHLKQYIYQHSTNDEIRKSLLGTFQHFKRELYVPFLTKNTLLT